MLTDGAFVLTNMRRWPADLFAAPDRHVGHKLLRKLGAWDEHPDRLGTIQCGRAVSPT